AARCGGGVAGGLDGVLQALQSGGVERVGGLGVVRVAAAAEQVGDELGVLPVEARRVGAEHGDAAAHLDQARRRLLELAARRAGLAEEGGCPGRIGLGG